MSYQVIARRFRPQTFDDIVGQEHVTRVLEGAIRSGRVAHAFLFCGPRGVGKTSTARILARALNCQKTGKPTPDPCNTCDVCASISSGTHLDTIEIDGASNRGIDDVRELREKARYAPVGGRYKLYIIDEVHMLTNEAFNALLKTLEEPPSHVVFVFATTEVQKVPATILSRCQRFDFRRLGVSEIVSQLAAIVAHEKYKIDDGALAVLARRGQGSMRDAESLLEQVIVAIDKRKKVDREGVEKLLGLTSTETFLELTRALKSGDSATALGALTQSLEEGAHLEELAAGLVEHVRNLLLLKVSERLAPATGLGEDVVEECRELVQDWSKGDLTRMLELLAQSVEHMRRSDFPQMHLEMALVRMAELPSTADLKTLVDRLGGEGGGGGGGAGGAGGGDASRRSAAAPKARPARSGRGSRGAVGPVAADESAPPIAEAPGAEMRSEAAPASPHAAMDPGVDLESRAESSLGMESRAELEPAGSFSEPSETAQPSAPRAPAAPLDPELGPRWERLMQRVKDKKASLASVLAEAVEPRLEDGKLTIGFDDTHAFFRSQLRDHKNRTVIQDAMRGVFEDGVKLKVREGAAAASPAASVEGAKVPLEYTQEVEGLVNKYGGVILHDG